MGRGQNMPGPLMSRSSGYINWPLHLRSTGEGGTWVMAVVCDDYTHNDYEHLDRDARPFERCHMDTLPSLPQPNCLVDPDPDSGDMYLTCPRCQAETKLGPPYNQCAACSEVLTPDELDKNTRQRFVLQERLWPWLDEPEEASTQSRQFLACICLGSSDQAYVTSEGERYIVSRQDLTPEGRELLMLIERLYGREAELLTFIDT